VDKIGFVWVRFKEFIVLSFESLVVVTTDVIIIFGFLKIGFVLHNLFILIDFFTVNRKSPCPLLKPQRKKEK
jgi:hypothetical protein